MARRLKVQPREVRARAIDPTALYTRTELPGLLRMGEDFIAELVRAGHLRCKWVGQRQFFLGQWLLDFLASDADLRLAVAKG